MSAPAARGAGRSARPGGEGDMPEEGPRQVALKAPARGSAPAEARVWTVHGHNTLPRLFRHVVKERGDKVAMREKHLGIWRAITWRDYGEAARHVGLGLVALGLKPLDVVSIIADNCPEWLY